MSKQDLSIAPHSLDEHAWWYEEDRGILIVTESRAHDGSYISTEQRVIPWHQIRAALRRLDQEPAPPRKRKRTALSADAGRNDG